MEWDVAMTFIFSQFDGKDKHFRVTYHRCSIL